MSDIEICVYCGKQLTVNDGNTVCNKCCSIVCPFCGDTDFDLPGLKYHLTYCEKFSKTEMG